jgi:hypothetical protein
MDFVNVLARDEPWILLEYSQDGVWPASRDEVTETRMTTIDTEKCMISVIWSISGIHSPFALIKGMKWQAWDRDRGRLRFAREDLRSLDRPARSAFFLSCSFVSRSAVVRVSAPVAVVDSVALFGRSFELLGAPAWVISA